MKSLLTPSQSDRIYMTFTLNLPRGGSQVDTRLSAPHLFQQYGLGIYLDPVHVVRLHSQIVPVMQVRLPV